MEIKELKKFVPHAALTVFLTAASLTAIYGLPNFSSPRPVVSEAECLEITSGFVNANNGKAAFEIARKMKKEPSLTSASLDIPEEIYVKLKTFVDKGCRPRSLMDRI